MRITTCIPKQTFTFRNKLTWLKNQLRVLKTDIFVTPQEYFGGDYIMPDENSFTKKFLLPILEQISSETGKAIIVGVVEKVSDEFNQEKMWFIDSKFRGEITKFAEPNYTVLGTGTYRLKPEMNLSNRLITFKIKNINVTGFFCWEVFSAPFMSGLGLLSPDLVVSQIKFGVAGYPTYIKNKSGLLKIKKILWCPGDIWIKRLNYASMFEVMTPIVCSTNSWNLPAKYCPLAGTYFPYENMRGLTVNDKKLTKDIVKTDTLDFSQIRAYKKEWYTITKNRRSFPPGSYNKYIMLFKMNVITRRLLQQKYQSHTFLPYPNKADQRNGLGNKLESFVKRVQRIMIS